MDVSRYVDTTELKFDVEFVTPTFLGGADGNAALRVAPFKNLLRRWWRIANGNLSPDELWKKESRLFGSTEEDPDIKEKNRGKKKSEKEPVIFGKSKVILKIINSMVKVDKKTIEVGTVDTGFGDFDLAKYLGYGAVGFKSFILPGSTCSFSLTVPKIFEPEIINTLFLIHLFGTIGSRSRNGWGSLAITPDNFSFNPKAVFDKFAFWDSVFANNKSYPTIIGKDKKGVLCWKTYDFKNWEDALKEVGTVYHKLLQVLKSKNPAYRNLLGFAKGNRRLPAQFILKVVRVRLSEDSCNYYGIIAHIPFLTDEINLSLLKNGGYLAHYYLDQELSGWQRETGGSK